MKLSDKSIIYLGQYNGDYNIYFDMLLNNKEDIPKYKTILSVAINKFIDNFSDKLKKELNIENIEIKREYQKEVSNK